MRISGFEDTYFPKNKFIRVRGELLDLSEPKIMGIINVTPDSFYSPSRKWEIDDVISRTGEMIAAGADIIDIGAQSTRPDAALIDEQEEIKRLIPAVRAIRSAFPKSILSIDTFRSNVVEAAVDQGIDLVNDISGGNFDPNLIPVVAKHKLPYVLMHNNATFDSMHKVGRRNKGVFRDLIFYFSQRIQELQALGLTDIIIDPGFGFGKTIDQNYVLFNRLEDLTLLGRPILVGISRKSMIYKKLDTSPELAINGTTALHTMALKKGASILRVHDVKEAKEIVSLLQAIG